MKSSNDRTNENIIVENPNILGGIPVVAGTRIPISRILYLIRLGYPIAEIKKDYPQLSVKQIKDVIGAIAKRAEEGNFISG